VFVLLVLQLYFIYYVAYFYRPAVNKTFSMLFEARHSLSPANHAEGILLLTRIHTHARDVRLSYRQKREIF